MHKFFAKTLFLGKKVTYLPECHSTNDYSMEVIKNGDVTNGHVVMTGHQNKGRGQRGNKWQSNPDQNLLASVILRPEHLTVSDQFYLQRIVSLSLVEVLQEAGIDGQIKWPNDVYVDYRKVAGILIENMITKHKIDFSVIGIGLNINQTQFDGISATSLKLESGHSWDIALVLEQFLVQLEKWLTRLDQGSFSSIRDSYIENLMWRGEEHEFQEGEKIFRGVIIGVTDQGKLRMNVGGDPRLFDLKEIKFLF